MVVLARVLRSDGVTDGVTDGGVTDGVYVCSGDGGQYHGIRVGTSIWGV